MILGTVIAYELLLGLSESASHGVRRGWGGASFQVITTAVVASRLFGLTHVQMRQAIGMDVSSHISLNRSSGEKISHWKAATSANDSRNGVFCALAARQGITGSVDIFAGKGGFFQHTGSQFELLPLGSQHSNIFRIMGAEIKGFPAGYPSHTGIEAATRAAPPRSRLLRISRRYAYSLAPPGWATPLRRHAGTPRPVSGPKKDNPCCYLWR